MGCKIGDDLFRSIGDFNESTEIFYTTPGSNYPGRKRSRGADAAPSEWHASSHETPRLNAAGESLRVVPGGQAMVARTIMKKHGCSRTTAYGYKPKNISAAKKSSDLCIHCEAMRRTRLAIIGYSQSLGHSVKTPDPHAGQKDVAAVGDLAAKFCAESGGGSEEMSLALQQYDILKWHEAESVAAQVRLRQQQQQGPCIVFDYAANIVN